VTVDETSPLARIRAVRKDDGSIAVQADGGAFEDTRRPRHFSDVACETALGRVLLRLLDREAAFADAPTDEELTLAQTAAWDTSCMARLARRGLVVNQQRWRYNFRNRHGFSDVGDECFDRLWADDEPTWAVLSALSDRALAARPAA
jgi:hypothetical protein